MSVKGFLVGVGKISSAIVVVIVALALIGWAAYELYRGHEASKNEQLSELKKWPTIYIAPLDGAKTDLSTMWRDGHVYYQFSVRANERTIAAALQTLNGVASFNQPQWILTFVDPNGFKVFSNTIYASSMTRSVDAKGRPNGLSINDDTAIEADSYRRSARWELTWNIQLPPEESAETNAIQPKPEFSGQTRPARKRNLAEIAAAEANAAVEKAVEDAHIEAEKGAVEMRARLAKAHANLDASNARLRESSVPKWRNQAAWRTLQKGMTMDEVKSAIGEPGKVATFGFGSFWYYGYPMGGEVTFSNAGIVESWTEP